MEIEVLNPGVSTTIQDLGRVNGLAYGVPYGGAMDRASAVLGNVVLGNPISNPIFECTLVGGDYLFKGSGHICISGAPFFVRLNDESIPYNTKVKVVKNKVAPPFKQVEFDILYGKGISKVGEIIDLGVDFEIIKKSGSWFSYDDTKLGQGREAVKSLLLDNPELMDELEQKIKEAIAENK